MQLLTTPELSAEPTGVLIGETRLGEGLAVCSGGGGGCAVEPFLPHPISGLLPQLKRKDQGELPSPWSYLLPTPSLLPIPTSG